MNPAQPVHPVSYVLSIWSEHQVDQPPVWHGWIEMPGGQRFAFTTLAGLERLLCELGGWVDPPESYMYERSYK